MPDETLENRYYQYLRENELSSSDALQAVLREYLPYCAPFQRVLDIGCGHGEFLRLLAEAGHDAWGLDIDPAMIAACRAQGLQAEQADAVDWLPGHPEAFDAVFSSNVLEHLPPHSVQALIKAAARALRPGGLLLVAVPNPASAVVQMHEFWRDATHVRLYDRQLLQFFMYDAGLEGIGSGENQASAWEGADDLLGAAQTDPTSLAWTGPAILPGWDEPARFLTGPTPVTFLDRVRARLAALLVRRVLGPYGLVERIDRQQVLLLALAARIDQQRPALQALMEKANGLERGYRWLHPPREVFVYAYRPDRKAETG